MLTRTFIKALLFISVLMLPLLAQAEVVQVRGKVKNIMLFSKDYGTYNPNDTGLAVIYMDELGGACGSTSKRVVITTDHPLFQSVVSTALTAKTTDASIEMWHLNSCTIRPAAWDFGLMNLI